MLITQTPAWAPLFSVKAPPTAFRCSWLPPYLVLKAPEPPIFRRSHDIAQLPEQSPGYLPHINPFRPQVIPEVFRSEPTTLVLKHNQRICEIHQTLRTCLGRCGNARPHRRWRWVRGENLAVRVEFAATRCCRVIPSSCLREGALVSRVVVGPGMARPVAFRALDETRETSR